MQTALFMLFSFMLLGSALMVITLQHPVKCALFLVLSFFSATGLWLLLTAEFLALVLVLVYVGAVMTLFLFVVMTINVDLTSFKQPYLRYYLPLGLLMAASLTALLIYALNGSDLPYFLSASNTIANSNTNVTLLGNVLYTQYALPFEIAAVILLVAMIAAISLTLFEPIRRKQQAPDEQIKVRRQDRVRLVK